MTLAVALLVMVAVGMFWYWQALPKQSPAKKNTRAARRANAAEANSAKKSSPAPAPAPNIDTQQDDHRAVSIQCREQACAAAKALQAQRFLVKSAPALPLPDCDHAPCHCSYLHHADQRDSDDDRRSPHSLQTELYARTDTERRKRSGRRRTDIA